RRQFILALGLHIGEEIESLGLARYWSESERIIPGKGDLHDYWRDILTDGDFLGPPYSYTLIRDLVLIMYYQMIAHSIAGRTRLAKHFGLLTAEILRGLTVIAPELPIIDMGELPDAMAGAPRVAQDAPIVDEGGQADPAPVHAPPPPAPARTIPFSTWAITGHARMMDRAGVTYVPYSDTHVPYQRRRVKQRSGEASTSATQQDP
ncbi:hypothetical protein Tco_1272106, partial [Tanacetum coccineum]